MASIRTLTQQTAVVTGAAQGLGRGIALSLAGRGVRVLCVDIADLGETIATIQDRAPGAATAFRVDVTKTEDVEALVSGIAEEQPIDILINNAAVLQGPSLLSDVTDIEYERVFSTNVRGVLAFCRAVAPLMQQEGYGRIVNIASQAAKLPWPRFGLYAASKAAVVALTQTLALELGPDGITVNAVCPGVMDTPMTNSGYAQLSAELGVAASDLIQSKIEEIPVRRLGTPHDAGETVAWLASPEAGFVNGATINLTGGEQVFF